MASVSEAQTKVAVIEVEHPGITSGQFLLRGTLPIPEGTFVESPQSTIPLSILNPDGSVAPTQGEIVARYADNPDGASSMELIAMVDMYSNWPVQEHKGYTVVLGGNSATYGNRQNPSMSSLLTTQSPGSWVPGILNDPQAIAIVAEDAFGERYVTYPLASSNLKLHRLGTQMSTLRTHGVMLPVTPGVDRFPHMFGVHSYISTVNSSDVLGLDLRLHNGGEDFNDTHTPGDRTDEPLGSVLFSRIDVYIDRKYELRLQQQHVDTYSHPAPYLQPLSPVLFSGRVYYRFPLVSPNADGKAHGIRSLGSFHRRLALFSPDDSKAAQRYLALEGVGFCKGDTIGGSQGSTPQWSWFSKETSTYFAQHLVLPTLDYTNPAYGGLADLRSTLSSWYEALRNAVDPFAGGALQEPDILGEIGLSYGNPLGNPNGTVTSGGGITFVQGERTAAASSQDGLRRLFLRTRMTTDRHINFVWASNGDPTKVEDWLVFDPSCGHCPNQMRRVARHTITSNLLGASDFFKDGIDPSYPPNDPSITGSDLSAGALAMFSYGHHDGQHLCRYAQWPKSIVWLANDPLAKDDLICIAANARFAWSEYSQNSNDPCDPFGASLLQIDVFRRNHPQSGAELTREPGWVLDVASAAYAIGSPALRAQFRPWFGTWTLASLGAQATGQDENGVTIGSFQAVHNAQILGLSVVGPNDPRLRQTWEEMIFDGGLAGVARSVYTINSPVSNLLSSAIERSCLSFVAPSGWNVAGVAPYTIQPITPNHSNHTCLDAVFTIGPMLSTIALASDPSFVPPSLGVPSGSDYHHWAANAALGLEIGGNATISSRALEFANNLYAGGNLPTLLEALQAHWDPTEPTSQYSQFSNVALLLGWAQNN